MPYPVSTMKIHRRRNEHTELVLNLASQDQRLLDMLRQRPYLLNPHPSILTRLSRRSRRFRLKFSGERVIIGSFNRRIAAAALGE